MKRQHTTNASQLHRLLTIPDPKKETIFGVVGRMKVLLEYLESQKQYAGLVPFLMTYYYVTKESAEKYISVKHYFWSVRDYETLDVYFASLYFKPLLLYLTTGKKSQPWEHYFTYCEKKNGLPLLQILLGINAHINADLYKAIVDLRYRHQSDFFLVNNILQEITPKVMVYLFLHKKDVIGFTGTVLKDVAIREFHGIIERWRSEVWLRASLTKSTNKKAMQERALSETERISTYLVQDISDMYHFKNLPTVFDSLHTLSVRDYQ